MVLLYSVVYYYDRNLFISPLAYYAGLIPMVFCMVLAVMVSKSRDHTAHDFKDVLSIAFTVYVLSALIYWVFYYLLIEKIDPELIVIQKDLAISQALEQYGSEDHPEVRRLRDVDFSLKWDIFLFTIAQGLLGGFIISALLALLLRDE